MKRTYNYPKSLNTAQLLQDRSYYNIETLIKNRLHTAPQFMERLELEATLDGHNGCVNCLEWSENGQLLASASDDYHVMIWDPFRHSKLTDIATPHHNNIFSVKFLPKSGNSKLATGAGDSHVHLFDINKDTEPIWSCHCHTLRVKRLSTAPESPHIFWSSGEDGYVLQFDIREPHSCSSGSKIVLLNLSKQISKNTEVKCIAINPRRPELLAVGCNDSYARIYDRRMISLRNIIRQGDTQIIGANDDESDNIPKECVTYFCPGHFKKYLHTDTHMHHKAITYLTFSPDGTELLVNMGTEQIYLYDLNGAAEPVFFELPPPCNQSNDAISVKEATKRNVPHDVEVLKKNGNEFLENEKYLQAITQYTAAIALMPDYPVLYLNRATALMRRNWYGDVYAALRDCKKALKLDPNYVKAHFRLARALLKLDYVTESNDCLNELKIRFPKSANDNGVKMLMKDISSAIESEKSDGNGDRTRLIFAEKEIQLRATAKDYDDWFVGHCNTTTDIKEANFFGNDGKYIVAGSDDGHFFMWERPSNMIHSIFKADNAIVNCVQPHPYVTFMATSGLDHEIRLWSPQSEETNNSNCRVHYFDAAVSANQSRMQTDPFDIASQPMCRTS